MRECPFLVVIVHSVTINFVSTLFIAEYKAGVSGQTRITLCIFISEITAREATNWQDQIISLKSAKKNWRGRKRKRKRDNSNWIKPLSNQKTIKTSPMMKTRIYRHRAAHCWFMQPRRQHHPMPGIDVRPQPGEFRYHLAAPLSACRRVQVRWLQFYGIAEFHPQTTQYPHRGHLDSVPARMLPQYGQYSGSNWPQENGRHL